MDALTCSYEWKCHDRFSRVVEVIVVEQSWYCIGKQACKNKDENKYQALNKITKITLMLAVMHSQ